MIDFKKEVLKYKDDLIKDTQDLLRINSELTSFDPNREGAPFGEGNKKALDFMLKLAKKDGFKVLNVDGYAGHIEYGESKDYIGSIGHLDVVPAGSDWTYPPYEAKIVDNKLYARGSEDDKGPTMAVYYAMKILKNLGVKLNTRIKLILGLDEESGWRCMDYYFKKHPEVPAAGFIADADFPLIYAEKGITSTVIVGKYDNNKLLSVNGGLRSNMVPESATAVLVYDESYFKTLNNYLKTNNFSGSVKKKDDTLEFIINGKSAHGSLPDDGINAISLLFEGLKLLNLDNDLVDFMNKYLTNDNYGKKLGVNYIDDEMGPLTVNLGLIKTMDNSFEVVLNLRYPKGVDYKKDVFENIEKLLPNHFKLLINHHQKLLYKDPKSKLIKTLLNVYRKHTNDFSEPISIGGGTFARATENLVAFGPHFPNKPTYIHQKDEYIDIDDLILATIIYTESLYELAK